MKRMLSVELWVLPFELFETSEYIHGMNDKKSALLYRTFIG